MRYYHNPAFRLKMLLFVIALIFHFTLQVRVARRSIALEQNSHLKSKVKYQSNDKSAAFSGETQGCDSSASFLP